MEQDWGEAKHRAMQGRLHSLRIRLIDLANNLANLTTEQLGIHCGAIVEDLRSFSYDCMVEGRDRLDEAQFQWRVGEIGELMDFSVDEELKNIERDEHHKPRMTREKRRAMLMDLRIDIPFTELCFVPYDAYDFFMNLGENLKDLVADELRHRARNHAMARLQSAKEEQGVSERPLPQRYLHEESITNNVLEQESRELAIRDNVYRCHWAANQVDAYQRYLQLPVTDDVASAAVEEYDDCVELQSPCPPGMSFLVLARAGDWWFAQPVNPFAKKPHSRGPMPNLEVITITRNQLRDDHELWEMLSKRRFLGFNRLSRSWTSTLKRLLVLSLGLSLHGGSLEGMSGWTVMVILFQRMSLTSQPFTSVDHGVPPESK